MQFNEAAARVILHDNLKRLVLVGGSRLTVLYRVWRDGAWRFPGQGGMIYRLDTVVEALLRRAEHFERMHPRLARRRAEVRRTDGMLVAIEYGTHVLYIARI